VAQYGRPEDINVPDLSKVSKFVFIILPQQKSVEVLLNNMFTFLIYTWFVKPE
jgi:hypothetical protein